MATPQADDPRRDHGTLQPGAPLLNGASAESDEADEFFDAADAETVATIKELIEPRVRPAVADDGGDITFEGFKDSVVSSWTRRSPAWAAIINHNVRKSSQNLLRHFLPDVAQNA